MNILTQVHIFPHHLMMISPFWPGPVRPSVGRSVKIVITITHARGAKPLARFSARFHSISIAPNERKAVAKKNYKRQLQHLFSSPALSTPPPSCMPSPPLRLPSSNVCLCRRRRRRLNQLLLADRFLIPSFPFYRQQH